MEVFYLDFSPLKMCHSSPYPFELDQGAAVFDVLRFNVDRMKSIGDLKF